MRFLRILRVSCRTLLTHRARSLLTALGVAIGVAVVFVTSALAEGAQNQVLSGMGEIGTELIVVRPLSTKPQVARKTVRGLVTSLRLEDSEAIERLASVREAAPALEGVMKVRAGAGTVTTKISGTTASFLRVRGYVLARGRCFDEAEERAQARLAVLGASVAALLFPGGDPIGQVIQVRGIPFEVIGALRPKGISGDGTDHDNRILIPVRTALRRVFDSRSLTNIFVSVQSPEQLESGEREIRGLLRQIHRKRQSAEADDFAVQNQAKVSRIRQEIAHYFGLLTAALGGIALIIGGTGVLGLMLLSVEERTTEIGLRMAVGARPRDIELQFFGEALLISLSGGVLGLAFGALGVWAVARYTEWQGVATPELIGISLAVAVTTGLSAGVFPARKAARITPVQAFGRE
jgi:putative ABC transport system permease protein